MKKWLCVLLAGVLTFSLVACRRGQNADTSGDVANQTAEKFLKGEISATDKDGRTVNVQNYIRGDSNKYALYDMSGDAAAELILKTGEGLTVFCVNEQGLTLWYCGTIYEKPLNNRAIFYERPGAAPEHTDYRYIVLDHNGKQTQKTSFSEYPGDNPEYFINGEKASKTDYEVLYKSFDLSDDKIVWKDIPPIDGTNSDNGEQAQPVLTFRVNSSHPEYTAAVNYSNGNTGVAWSITIQDNADQKEIQMIDLSDNELFAEKVIYTADVTFDGNLDILIPYQRSASACFFQAYVWQEKEGRFVHAPTFKGMANFAIDKENKCILSTQTSSQITSYSMNYYDAEANDFNRFVAVLWFPHCSDSEKMHFEEERYEDDKLDIVKYYDVGRVDFLDVDKSDPQIAEYFAAGSFWDLDNAKWKNYFYNPYQSGTTEENTEDVQITVTDAFIASCNQNSGGYINYLNGKYYYRNTEADKLFMCDADGKNAVCIDNCSGATVSSITVDETAVYYMKRTKLDTPLVFNNSSVTYSVMYEGQLRRFCDGKVTVLTEENVLSYALSEDYIFYSTADLKVYRMKHDGTQKTAIVELSNPMTMLVSGNKLYAYRDEEVVSMDFDGKNVFTSRLYIYAGAFDESNLYYINLNNFELCKTQLSDEDTYAGIDNAQSVTDEKIRSYTVYNGQLAYEKMLTDEIVIADMDGKNPKVVCSGKSPIALNGHLFYLDNGVIKVADI